MSTYFSKVIKAGERLREFNFRQTTASDEARYSVDVPDDKGNRIMFSMYKNAESEWKTAAQLLPLWVHEAETMLAEAIEENRKNEVMKKR
jgi:uridine kinase